MSAFFWLFGAMNVANGLWMLLAPASWYHGLPAEVPDTGPLNPHFVRDIGAAFLTLGVALWAAAPAARRHPGVLRATALFYGLHALVHVADLLAGRNPEANQAIASLFAGATAEMPEEYRARVASIGRDIAGFALNNPVSSAAQTVSIDRSLQARKDLTAMGLRYYDEGQFLDAVKRNDQLAAELFIAGRGVNLEARTWTGRSALDIARDNGNTKLAELISRSLPSVR